MMKHWLCTALTLLILVTACGCSGIRVRHGDNVDLSFVYAEQDIHVTLSDEEAEQVITILEKAVYDPVLTGIPSCGFDKNISLKVGNRVYAVARDTCNKMQDLGGLRCFTVLQEDIEYIHSLFEKYGGRFPCV